MGAAGSVQAKQQLGEIPEKLTEEQCKALIVEEHEWTEVVPGHEVAAAAKFQELAVDGFVTREQFLEQLQTNKSFYDEEKIKNCIKGLEGAPWKDPEYFKTLEAKFV